MKVVNVRLLAREKVGGHIPLDGPHLALRPIFFGHNVVVLLYHLARLVDR